MKEFFATQNAVGIGILPYPFPVFLLNLLLTILAAYVLAYLYRKSGHVLSNRSAFSGNFVLLALSTLMIIAVVQTSIALSLGLVGALSIVRFRAAIKEPEELTFLFLAIGMGVGFGANQPEITLTVLVVVAIVLGLRSVGREKKPSVSSFWLTVSSEGISVDSQVHSILASVSLSSSLVRTDRTSSGGSATWQLIGAEPESIEKALALLEGQLPTCSVQLTQQPQQEF